MRRGKPAGQAQAKQGKRGASNRSAQLQAQSMLAKEGGVHRPARRLQPLLGASMHRLSAASAIVRDRGGSGVIGVRTHSRSRC